MSEQKLSFMEALDQWTDANVVSPLLEADPYEPDNSSGSSSELMTAVKVVKQAIRHKVLESYRNGQAAGPRPAQPARKEQKYAQAKTR